MASLAEKMVAAGAEKAKSRKSSKGTSLPEPCNSPCYVNVERAVNGYTIRFGGGDMGWDSKTAVASDAKEIGEAIVKFLESQDKK